jgi:hypothetical protein
MVTILKKLQISYLILILCSTCSHLYGNEGDPLVSSKKLSPEMCPQQKELKSITTKKGCLYFKDNLLY